MDTRDIVELTTLIGGIVASVAGALNQIKQRRAADAALTTSAGAEAVATAKAAQDIAVDPTRMQQMQAHINTVEAELAAARQQLRQQGITQEGAP